MSPTPTPTQAPPADQGHARAAHEQAHDHGHHANPTGWRRFAYSTNHKDIGTMYLIFAVVAGIIGTAMSIWFRLELQAPGTQFIQDHHFFNVLVTAHGLIMVF